MAAIIAGWALAQQPSLLPGLSIRQAAAPHETLVAIIIAVLAGGAILFPSLGLLFKLTLSGRLDHDERPVPRVSPARVALPPAAGSGLLIRLAVACLISGVGFLTFAEAGWAHAIGVVALLAFIAIGFVAATPGEFAEGPPGTRNPRS